MADRRSCARSSTSRRLCPRWMSFSSVPLSQQSRAPAHPRHAPAYAIAYPPITPRHTPIIARPARACNRMGATRVRTFAHTQALADEQARARAHRIEPKRLKPSRSRPVENSWRGSRLTMGRHARLGPFWSPRLRCSSKRAAPRSDASSGSVGRPGRPGVRRACSTASLRDSNGVHMHGIPSPRPLRAWWAPGGVSVQHGSWLHGRRRRRRRRRRAPRLSTGCDCRAGGQRLVGYGAAARAVFVGRASEPTENSELRARRPDWEPASGQGECGPSPSL